VQCLGVAAVPGDHDDEVVGVPDQPPVPETVPAASGPLDFRSHLLLPLPGEVVVERRQRDVGQQRGEYPALRGAGIGLFPPAVGRHDPGFEERLDQRAHPLVRDPPPEAVHQGRMTDLVEAAPDVGFQRPLITA
jgi:hypothetical protein